MSRDVRPILLELLRDCDARPDRLTKWEREFMESMRLKTRAGWCDISDGQFEIVERIQRKVYAT